MKLRLHPVAGAAAVVAALALSGVQLEPAAPPAEVGSLTVTPQGESWESPPLAVVATAVGLSWEPGNEPDEAWVRASGDGDEWGPWVDLHADENHGPDPGTAEAEGAQPGTDPVYVGKARFIQLRVEGASGPVRVEYAETAGRNLSLLEKARFYLSRITIKVPTAEAAPDMPAMVTRQEWGGDACLAGTSSTPTYVKRVQILFVHATIHAPDSNAYTPEQAKDIVYAICVFHVKSRGWQDIGYNFLIDRYGVIYEGRAGGVDKGVQGAQTGGFNSYSTGVALIGDFRNVIPTPAAQDALVRLAAWKLDVHNLDPLGSSTVESLGSSRYPAGTMVTFPTVAGHRDASATTDPGDAGYALLDQIRQRIAGYGGPKIYGGWPDFDPIVGSPSKGYTPTPFRFRFTEPMSWTFTISGPDGAVVLTATGSGGEGSVVWDGTLGGAPLPNGQYRADLQALPLSGAPTPRPASFLFDLGDFQPPFRDDDGSPYQADIAALAEEGVTTGCGPELFCPQDGVTRWQMGLFLTRLWAAAGLPPPPLGQPVFTDLAGLSPEAVTAAEQLLQMQVTVGCAPGRYCPADNVTRWQMALFLVRLHAAAGLTLPEPADQGFTDLTGLSPEAVNAVNLLAQLGVTTGTSPTTFTPQGVVTREQMASFLIRSLANLRPSPTSPES